MSWEEVKISEVYKALYDGPHATPTLCIDGPIFLSIANVSETGQLDLTSTKHISESEYPKWTKRVTPRAGDLVFTYEASLHRYAIIPKNFVGCLGRRLALVRPDNNKAYYKYLFYYFLSDSWRKEVGNYILTGTTVDRVPLTKFPQFKIRLPDLKTQKKIASILSAYDDLIENNKRRIALLENMAEEIYREWFVRFRFPGYQTAEFEKGIPKGWGLVRLEHAFQYMGGGTPSKNKSAYWTDGKINWYTPSDITGSSGLYLTNSEDNPNEEGLARSSAKLFPAYSIMLTSRATIGAIGINRTEACTNQGFITCIPNETYLLTYLYHWLKLSKEYFISLCGGATFPELTKTTFKRIEILTPEKEIVLAFEALVKPMFHQIDKLMCANDILSTTKDSLLPRLISGKLSVENLDIQFPPSMQQDAS